MLHRETKSDSRIVTIVIREWATCDICNDEIIEDRFDIREGRVSLKIGSSYPEGGSATEIRADLCEKCFTSKLVPWLESQGATVQRIETDW